MSEITTDYDPRSFFMDYHLRTQKRAMMVAHRRAGKTVAVLGDMAEKALYNPRTRPRYGYIAPLYSQAKQVAWEYLKAMTKQTRSKPPSESGLYVELINDARITLYGADNPDAFRGLYFDGVALDEYGNMKPSVWTQVLIPALSDRQGWATFIGTPNGPNHFRDQWLRALKTPKKYFTKFLPVTETDVITPEELDEMRLEMTEEEFEQEMMCNFEAATRGAFFAREIKESYRAGRVQELKPDEMPLNFVFDLGFRDDTCCWVWQERPDGHALLKAFSNNNRPIAYYIALIHTICAELGAPRGKVWLPHDARAKTLQTGRSIVEQFVLAGIRPEIVPNLDLMDGIGAARMIFDECYFDEKGCEEGLLALRSYHREYDEDKKVHRDVPVHDWSSHYADAFRYFALVARSQPKPSPKRVQELYLPNDVAALRTFNLEDLYKTTRTPIGGRI